VSKCGSKADPNFYGEKRYGFTDRILIVKNTGLKLRSCWIGRNISRRSSYLWWSAYGEGSLRM